MAVWYWQCMRCMKESHDKEMAATLSDSVRTLERLLRSPARHNKNSERCPEEAPPKNRPWRPGDKSAPPLCAAKFLVTTVVQTLSPICARMHCLVRSENEHFATGTAFSSINNSQTLQSFSPSEEPRLCIVCAALRLGRSLCIPIRPGLAWLQVR